MDTPPTELVVRVTRRGVEPLDVCPAQITIAPAKLGIDDDELKSGRYRLAAPHGWSRRYAGALTWIVIPTMLDPDRRHMLRLEYTDRQGLGARQWTLPVRVELDLYTTFEPRLHAVRFPNGASAIGDVLPTPELMRDTYLHMPGALSRVLFGGLYRNIVYLRKVGPARGGLCTGMARWSIACSHGDVRQPPTVAEIALYHGRQLNDRALLASLPWFLRGSPRAAFRAVRDDALATGTTQRALDVAVPNLWRKDVLSALVQEGHTVVPFRVRQSSPETAYLDVYDPNRPPEDGSDNAQTIEFKLSENRYSYRHMASFEDGRIGMIATSQRAYAARGTAVLAAVGSVLMRLGSVRRAKTARGPSL